MLRTSTLFVAFAIWFSCVKSLSVGNNDFREVKTECGPVQAKRSSEKVYGKKDPVNVYEFRNIPYAQAPVGALRWRPPVRLSKDKSKCWKGTLKYDEKKIVSCKQNFPLLPQTEDCLVLTVRTPSLKGEAKLPVMVWIHGGGMLIGNNEMQGYHPDNEFSAHMNVVTVSINYRLGVFGFMSLKELWVNSGPDESYGNYGIMDQIEALKWVQKNIENFGGDPKNVALYGESGGGTAVYCLLSSPLTRGLFQKASPASGAPRIRTTHLEADKLYRGVIDQTNCQKSTDTETGKCLQEFDADKLLSFFNLNEGSYLGYQFSFPFNVPYTGYPIETLDPKVVPVSPDRIKDPVNCPVELLIGTCAQEMTPSPDLPNIGSVNVTTYKNLRQDLKPKMDSFQKGLYHKMLKAYQAEKKCPEQSITPKYLYEVMATDALLTCATNKAALHLSHVDGFTVSRFIFSQPPSKEIGLGFLSAYHAWDSTVLFGLKFFTGSQLPTQDQHLMIRFRDLYKSFFHSTERMCLFRGKTTDFWANTSFFTDGVASYHQDECCMWNEAGVLNHSWNDLGKPN